MSKRKVFVAALAVCLVAILSLGSLAWFNANDDITNNFFVTTDQTNTNPEFTVEITETGDDGQPTTTGREYYEVLPGETISKDPLVKNTGDYSQWIRVTVTLTKANYWSSFGGSLVFTELFEGSSYGLAANVATDTTNKWLLVEDEVQVNAENNAVWYLYLNREFGVGSDEKVFETVNIPENFTLDEMLSMGGGFEITVSADALQHDHTGENAVEAFANVGWTAGTAFVESDVA